MSYAEAKRKYAKIGIDTDKVLKDLGADKKALVVLPGRDESVIRAAKNIPGVKDAYVNTINVYDLLNADKIIVLKAAMENIQEVYA